MAEIDVHVVVHPTRSAEEGHGREQTELRRSKAVGTLSQRQRRSKIMSQEMPSGTDYAEVGR